MRTSSLWSTAVIAALAAGTATTYVACSASNENAAGGGGLGGTTSSGGMGGSTGTGGELTGGFTSGGGTPTGVDGGCGYAVYPTEREPGVLLLVFDQSCSMRECADGSTVDCNQCPTPSKWELARDAMQTVLTTLPDELRMGLILYPDGGAMGCAVAAGPHVAPDELSTTRQPILNEFNITPDGGGTPTLPALELAYATLSQLNDAGNKAALLVTDGEWNCGGLNLSDLIFAAAEQAYTQNGFETYVVGIQDASPLLSHLAHVGGTDRVAGCNPDYPSLQFPFVEGCANDPATCCNYTVGTNVTVELVAALEQVASQLLTNCIFPVPKGDDPSQFDPGLVNVYVDGEIVPPDPNEGWTYTDGNADYIEIHGDLCEQLLNGEADSVEIELGCPTIPPT